MGGTGGQGWCCQSATLLSQVPMLRIRPPTLLGLIGLGFLVVALPLIVAIVTAIIQVEASARESHRALVSVQQNTSLSWALADRAIELERTARQFQALADPTYKELYHQHRREFQATLERLVSLNREPELQAVLERARQSEKQTNEMLESSESRQPDSLETAFSSLRGDVRAVVSEHSAAARTLSDAMQSRADDLQHLLILQAAFVIPLSVVLAVLFGILILRPTGQIERGIRSLGRGALRESIHIKGTRDLEELGERLEWLRVRLIELESQKAEFLRNVSHELKTPLTNIREGVELLTDDIQHTLAPAEREAILRILRNNGARLQQMIEELLRYGADGSLRSERIRSIVRLDQLIRDAVEKASPGTQDVILRMDIEPARVEGNSRHLRAIVDNLLSNALKYSPCGGAVDVVLGVKDGLVTLDVSDQGPGVRSEDAAHVFDWFYTGPQPVHSLVAGTGMGLAIAQEYARQHHGEIRLVPSRGGAHFRLTLKESRDGET